jgi:hypothetical protein
VILAVSRGQETGRRNPIAVADMPASPRRQAGAAADQASEAGHELPHHHDLRVVHEHRRKAVAGDFHQSRDGAASTRRATMPMCWLPAKPGIEATARPQIGTAETVAETVVRAAPRMPRIVCGMLGARVKAHPSEHWVKSKSSRKASEASDREAGSSLSRNEHKGGIIVVTGASAAARIEAKGET